jgi:DNA-binding MarR family transcriptional regulator
MQASSASDVGERLEALVTNAMTDRAGFDAWSAFLKAHASLVRQLDIDLDAQTGLSLGDFDVLAQLGLAGGELRMTELAHRALISRSGMTRRVARLVEAGLVHRAGSEADARVVVVSLTDAGVDRLLAVAPVHLQDVDARFVQRLDAEGLAALQRALAKVSLDCSFG